MLYQFSSTNRILHFFHKLITTIFACAMNHQVLLSKVQTCRNIFQTTLAFSEVFSFLFNVWPQWCWMCQGNLQCLAHTDCSALTHLHRTTVLKREATAEMDSFVCCLTDEHPELYRYFCSSVHPCAAQQLLILDAWELYMWGMINIRQCFWNRCVIYIGQSSCEKDHPFLMPNPKHFHILHLLKINT